MDGRPIDEIPLHVLHRDVAYVPQENFMFSDTLEENIAFGLEDRIFDHPKLRDNIKEAAEAACIHSNITKIPARNKPCCVGRESGSKGKYPRTPIRPFPRKKTLSKKSSFQPAASEQISQGSSLKSFRMMTPPNKPSAAHDTGSLHRWQMRCRSYTRRCPRQRSHRQSHYPSA